MTHDELQHDLAGGFAGDGEVILEKLALGSYGGNGQMDVFRMRLSRTNPNPTCYEVKVSRADFLADTQAGKYRRYLPYVRRIYFAAPSGLLSKADVPADAGLIVRGGTGWSVVKAAPIQKPDPERWPSLLMSIVLKLHPGPWQKPSRYERILAALKRADAGDSLRHLGLRLSERVDRQIEAGRRAVEELEFHRKSIILTLGLDADDATPLAQLVRRALAHAKGPASTDALMDRSALRQLLTNLEYQEKSLAQIRTRLEAAANGGAHA